MRAKSVSYRKRSSSVQNARSLSRTPRGLTRGRDRNQDEKDVKSLITNLEHKNISDITVAIQKLTDFYASNKCLDVFFSDNVPIKIFQATLRNSQNSKIFEHGTLFLRLFMESCASLSSYSFENTSMLPRAKCLNSLLDYIIAKLNNSEMLYNIYFYVLIGDIISSYHACVPFVHTLSPIHFIQVYLNKVCNNLDMCSQTTNSLSVAQLDQICMDDDDTKGKDANNSNRSAASVLTVTSDLSLREDCTIHKTYKQSDDALSEIASTRSILSNFAETVFGNFAPGQGKKIRRETTSYGKLPLVTSGHSAGSSMISDCSSSEVNVSQRLDSVEKEKESNRYSQSNDEHNDSNSDLNSNRSNDFTEDLFEENDLEDQNSIRLEHQVLEYCDSIHSCNQGISQRGEHISAELTKDSQIHHSMGLQDQPQDVSMRNNSRSSRSGSSTSFCEKDRLLELPALENCISGIPQQESKIGKAKGRPPGTRGVKVRLPPVVHEQQNNSRNSNTYDALQNDVLIREASAPIVLTPFNLGTISEAKESSAELRVEQNERNQPSLGSVVPSLNIHLPITTNGNQGIVDEKSSHGRQALTTARRQSRYMIHGTKVEKGRGSVASYVQASHSRATEPTVKNRSSSNLLMPPPTPNGALSGIEEPFAETLHQSHHNKDTADPTNMNKITVIEKLAVSGPLALPSKNKIQRPSIVPRLALNRLLQYQYQKQEQKQEPEKGDTSDITTQATSNLSQKKVPSLSLGSKLPRDFKSVHNGENMTLSMSHQDGPGRSGDVDSSTINQHQPAPDQEIVNDAYNKCCQILSERRKGLLELINVAGRIGEYMFMRDYPLLCSLSRDKFYSHGSANLTDHSMHSSLSVLTTSTSQVIQTNYIIGHLYVTQKYCSYLKRHRHKHRLYKLFGSTHTRDLSEYDFSFSIISTDLLPLVRLQKVDLSKDDVIRLGVSYVLYYCIKSLSSIILKYLPNILPSICTDLISLHQRKAGFMPAVVLALSTLVNQIHSASQTSIRSDWSWFLFKMYKYVEPTYDYIDLDIKECIPESELSIRYTDLDVVRKITQENSLKMSPNAQTICTSKRKIGKRRTITLPNDMFLLQRLESRRKMYCRDIYTIALRLKTLVMIPYSMSACDDIACYLAVIADRLATSRANPMVRGLIITAILPSLLRIIELFKNKFIKSRLHYLLIGQRILEVMSLLASDSSVRIASLVTDPEPPIVRALVNDSMYYTTDKSMQNIDNVLYDALILDETNLKWLIQYSCLIFLNTRIKDELSGMYYSKAQCQHSFEVYKIKFSRYMITMIRLLRQRFLKLAQQISMSTKLETTKMFTAASHSSTNNSHIASRSGDSMSRQSLKLATSSSHAPIYVSKYANLPENDYPRGLKEVTEYTLETKLKNLPINSLANLCTLEKHANIFTAARLDHIPLTRCDESHRLNVKEILRNDNCHTVIERWSFLFDFETGIFPQYLVLAKNDSSTRPQTKTIDSTEHLGPFCDSDLLKAMPTAETIAEARNQHTAAKELLTELSKNAISAPTSRKSVLYVLYVLSEFFAIENVDLYIKSTDLQKFISFHYKSFLKLYNDCEVDLIDCILSNNSSVSLLDLCNGHLNVLCSLVQMNSPNIRQYFYELRIVQFLILQLSVDSIDQNEGWQKKIKENDATMLQQINIAKAEADREWTMQITTSQQKSQPQPQPQPQQKQPQKVLPPIPTLNNIIGNKNQDKKAIDGEPTKPTKTNVFFDTPVRPSERTAHSAGSRTLKNKDSELAEFRAKANAISSMIEEDAEDGLVDPNASQESKKSTTPSLSTKRSVSAILTPGLEIKPITDNSSTVDQSDRSDIADCNVNDQLQQATNRKQEKQESDIAGKQVVPSIDTLFDYHGSVVIHPLKLPSMESELLGSQQYTDRDTLLCSIKKQSTLATTAVPKRSIHIYDDDDSDSCWDDEAQKRGIELPKRAHKRQETTDLNMQQKDKVTDAYSSYGSPDESSNSSNSSNLPLSTPAAAPKSFNLSLKLPTVKISTDKQDLVLGKESNSQNIAGGISQFESAADSLNPKFHLVLGNRIAAKLETASSLPTLKDSPQAPKAAKKVEQPDDECLKQVKHKQKPPKLLMSMLKRAKSTTSSSVSLTGAVVDPIYDTDSGNDKEACRPLLRSATVAKLGTQNTHQLGVTHGGLDKSRVSLSAQSIIKEPLFSTHGTELSTISGYRDVEYGNQPEPDAFDFMEYSSSISPAEKALHRPLYIHDELHYTILRIILLLIIVPETGTLDPMYCSQFPVNDGMINILWILHHHLNHPKNEALAFRLIASDISPAAKRLLRLTCYNLFDPTLYPIKDNTKFLLVAQGAYGSVYFGNVSLVTESNQKIQSFLIPVAVKLQERSKTIYDRCVLHDIFNEIAVMERLANYSGVSRMYNYGVTKDGYYIIMHRYVTSLKDLRLKLFDDPATLQSNQLLYHPEPKYKHLPIYGHELSYMKYIRIYLLIFIKFLRHLEYLHTCGVNHYDIKADNVFFDPRTPQWYVKLAKLDENNRPSGNVNTGAPITKEFLDKVFSDYQAIPSYELLPFRIAIADFGESMIFSDEESSYTLINKGTEYNKSPEMLLAANMVAQTRSNFDRRRPKGAGSSSDVWSAACFLYELLTGDILFYDSDWIRFFIRVTKDSYQSNARAKARDKSATQSFTFDHHGKFSQLYRGVSLSPEKKAMLGNCQPIIDLLEFCLVPNPTLRPQIRDVISMTEHILTVYFPETYAYKVEHYYLEPVKAEPFISSSFCFSIIGGVNDCLVNPSDVLAPKLSIVKKECDQPQQRVQNNTNGQPAQPVSPRGSIMATSAIVSTNNIKYKPTNSILVQSYSVLPSHIMPLATNIMDGLLWIGSVSILRNVDSLLAYNVTSVIDCLTNSLERSIEIKRAIETANIHYYKLPLILTQIINPSSNNSLFSNSPRSIVPGVNKAEFSRYSSALDSVLDFLRRTVTHGGRCLLYDEYGTGLSSAVAIAMLVEFRSLSLFSAYLHIRNLRPNIDPPPPFLDFLHYWALFRLRSGIRNEDFLRENSTYFKQLTFDPTPAFKQLINLRISKARYQCLCGKVFFIINPAVKRMPTFVLCNCAYTPPLPKDSQRIIENSPDKVLCPTLSCRSIINLFMSLHGLRIGRILWAFFPARDVISNWKTETMKICKIPSVPHAIEQASVDMYNKFTSLDNMRAPINRIHQQKNWELHYCNICGLITHAVDSSSSDAVQLAIIANFSPK